MCTAVSWVGMAVLAWSVVDVTLLMWRWAMPQNDGHVVRIESFRQDCVHSGRRYACYRSVYSLLLR